MSNPVTLTTEEAAVLAVLARYPRASDTARARAAGLTLEGARRVAWSLRAKLGARPSESVVQAAERLGIGGRS